MQNVHKWAAASLLLLVGQLPAHAAASDYELGSGLGCGEHLTVGGYFAMEYGRGNGLNYATLEDLAVLAYGSFGDRFSYMAELESADFYRYDFKTNTSDNNVTPAVERLYGDYKFSDFLSVRAGKQITPIGYWNLQPINVLRETTSNPLYSSEMFPKFLTGIDLYGYAPFDPELTYHLYGQATRDLDSEYINIDIDSHYGLAVQRNMGNDWKAGGALGRYTVDSSDARVYYAQANARLDRGKVTLLGEGMFAWRDLPGNAPDATSHSAYIQGEYHFTVQHAAVLRGEYFDGFAPGDSDWIGVIGYSFRPVYPVSLKVEWQCHEDDQNNKLLSSFSVLF